MEQNSSSSPSGLDLHPTPQKAVRISRRASIAIISVIVLVLCAFAYGGYRRTQINEIAAREAGLPRSVTPATQAGTEFMRAIPTGPVLRPPEPSLSPQMIGAPCGVDPRTNQSNRFNPQTGQPCDGLPQERVVVRQPVPPPPVITTPIQQETPEERRRAAAFAQEQEAMQAPTTARSVIASNVPLNPTDLSKVEAFGTRPKATESATPPTVESDYETQNMQSRKEGFVASTRKGKADDYLYSTREAPLSRFEIKAGWEIPAVLEQSLNSDLPGELKALVRSNVYDTATGLYLLIPQGSRLIGKYDSRVAYGQDGVQVAWSRIIYPDASSIDLDGMLGLDSRGNSGLRDQVDRHYRRLIGFAVLTSLFTAAFEISQRTSQSALTYPSPAQTAGTAVGQELSQTGSQITRRNLNVQPTVKVPVGYKFTVRVNRDILFEAPYASSGRN